MSRFIHRFRFAAARYIYMALYGQLQLMGFDIFS